MKKDELIEVEIIDLDEIEEECEWTDEGVNLETGEYDPTHDAFYPDFKALADAERELFGKRSF